MATTREHDPRASIRLRLAAGAVALALSVGCSGPGDAGRAGEEGTQPDGDSAHTYTVRGQVGRLPQPADEPRNLYVRHEAIHDFVNSAGEVVGMDAMAMPFELADGVPLDGIDVGDVVELTLVVDWDADDAVQVTAVRELPPGTELVFEAARPESAGQDDN